MSRMKLPAAAFCLGLFGLSGCGGPEPEPPPPASRPVRIFVVEGGSTEAIRTFPGRVDATQRAELVFRVGGQLQQLLLESQQLSDLKR